METGQAGAAPRGPGHSGAMNQLPGTPEGRQWHHCFYPACRSPSTGALLSPQKTPPQGRHLPLIALLQDQNLVTWRGLHPPLLPVKAFFQARNGGASVVKGFDQKVVKALSSHSSETASGRTVDENCCWKEHSSLKAVCSGGPASQVP